MSEKSLLSIIVPARDVRSMTERLATIVEARLRRLDIDSAVLAAEVAAMKVVMVAKTTDRSVTGQMVDFAKSLPFHLPVNEWGEREVQAAEDQLAETPCRAGRRLEEVIFPNETAPRLLNRKWAGDRFFH